MMVTQLDSAPFPSTRDTLDAAARRAAPLWPLERFVAVNPFLGFSELTFLRAAEYFSSSSNTRIFAPRAYYLDALKSGRIQQEDLRWALKHHRDLPGAPESPGELIALAQQHFPSSSPTTLAHASGWHEKRTDLLSRWAAAYFDRGQARWASPFKDLSPYRAWREEAKIDRSPEQLGLRDFRAFVANRPDDPVRAAEEALRAIGLADESLERYLHGLTMSLAGWTGYARFLAWESGLNGKENDGVQELLAILLVWEHALLLDEHASTETFSPPSPGELPVADLILQSAFERGWFRTLRGALRSGAVETSSERPSAQLAFCIDVRSEVFRRSLEASNSRIETLGFAGFFGFPIEVIELGQENGPPRCPALLAPQHKVAELPADSMSYESASQKRSDRISLARAWRALKSNAIASFAFVEALGIPYAGRLLSDSLGLGKGGKEKVGELEFRPGVHFGRSTGISAQQRIDLAASALTGMGLDHGRLAPVVVLAGHGSTTVNNPHGSGLGCGACGGHSGDHNARVAADVLNDPVVRAGLEERGIKVPDDTHFLAALHDTTTDEVTLLGDVPESHRRAVADLEISLKQASAATRSERATRLSISAGDVHHQIIARSKDWSQVRPEWGLAGCAAFVVAPRERTRNADLGGRVFLHDYDWRRDEGFAVLESIMTAPMIVTSWINLQYYASSANNEAFGSGNKTLHNVVSGLGVLEGNGGDLRVGLPLQSVSDGSKLVHEPLRLHVFVEAPTNSISAIVERHTMLREPLDHQWLILYALDEDGIPHRYLPGSRWQSESE